MSVPDKSEIPLQAVLLADSFTKTFRPLSLDTPKVLSPLNNVAMLDYTIEWLASSGVRELFVFAVHHADSVEAYVEMSKWSSAIKVTCVKDEQCTNPGDALREMDKRGLVRSDPFILMSGDVITNADVKSAIKDHEIRHKKDPSAMMTVLFKEVGEGSELRAADDDLVVGLNPDTSRIVLFDDRSCDPGVEIPSSFFDSHKSVSVRSDLLDCGIDICSPDVLARFSDEFDYRSIRSQFVRNSVAEEEEGLQNKIFGHVLSANEYAARVHDFRTYAKVSRDMIYRWVYPVVPDNLPSGYERKYRYEYARHATYREARGETTVDRTAVVGNGCIIGADNTIAAGCRIGETVLGRGCAVGVNVSLVGSHLWDGVVVEDFASVSYAIVGEGAVIKKGAVVGRGCVIGKGCVVGENVVLPNFTRITNSQVHEGGIDDGEGWSSDEDDGGDGIVEEKKTDHGVVGPDGVGRVYAFTGDDDDEDEWDEEEELKGELTSVESQSLGFERAGELREKKFVMQEKMEGGADEFGPIRVEDGGVDGADDAESGDKDDSSFAWGGGGGDVEFVMGRQRGVDVVSELKNLCLDHEEGSDLKNLAIEMNSFKFSQNATYVDCCHAAALAVGERISGKVGGEGGLGKVVGAAKREFESWSELFAKLSPRVEDGVGIVVGVESLFEKGQGCWAEIGGKDGAFRFLLQTLYDLEVVSEETLLRWADERRSGGGGEVAQKLFQEKGTQDFLEWLEDDEDDSDEDDEDDSD